jgi:hypothetical protein
MLTVSFTNLDCVSDPIILINFDCLRSELHFKGCWGSSKNWLGLKNRSTIVKFSLLKSVKHSVVNVKLSKTRLFHSTVDGGGVRAVDGEADDGHAIHVVQHLLQKDSRHLDRHRFCHPPLTPLLRVSGTVVHHSEP